MRGNTDTKKDENIREGNVGNRMNSQTSIAL